MPSGDVVEGQRAGPGAALGEGRIGGADVRSRRPRARRRTGAGDGAAGTGREVDDLGEGGEGGDDEDADDGDDVVAHAATLLHAVDLLAGAVRLESVARLARLTLLPARRHWI